MANTTVSIFLFGGERKKVHNSPLFEEKGKKAHDKFCQKKCTNAYYMLKPFSNLFQCKQTLPKPYEESY